MITGAVPYVGVPDQLLFEEDFYCTLNEVLLRFPDAKQIKFVVSSLYKQIHHSTGNLKIDSGNANVCVCDVFLPSELEDNSDKMAYLTEKLYQSLSPNIRYH